MEREMNKLSYTIAGAAVLRGQFNSALKTAKPTEFVPKPSTLSGLEKQRRATIANIRAGNEQAKLELDKRAAELREVSPSLSSLESYDLAVKSWVLQQRLRDGGALYGEYEFNFSLTDLRLPAKTITEIENAALGAFATILNQPDIDTSRLTSVERFVEEFRLKANGARIDVILTTNGPKVIEANMQWVDAIQALEGLQTAYLGKPQRPSPTEIISRVFKGVRKIAIVDLSRGSGSRKLGVKLELEKLAQTMQTITSTTVEVINPQIVIPEYLKTFDAYYINGEPRMIMTTKIPEWLGLVYERARSGSAKLFPVWRPSLDQKQILVPASSRNDIFVSTTGFSPEVLDKMPAGTLVLKGNGFSSNSVSLSGTPEFEGMLTDASNFPEDFVVQPFMESANLGNFLVYDTSLKRPFYLENPRSKFNVWIINGKVAGIMASLSDNKVISDKDFNVVPKPI